MKKQKQIVGLCFVPFFQNFPNINKCIEHHNQKLLEQTFFFYINFRYKTCKLLITRYYRILHHDRSR